MSPDPAKRIRVLFVEDAFDEALLVKAILSPDQGYDVTHSQDGDHAVALLEERGWDILVTDLNLPGTDGFAVIRAARAKYPRLPILATTGYTGAAYHDEALRAGANDVLTKPLDQDDFAQRVQASTGGRSGRPSGGVRTSILAVGGLAGDVEMGCGGSLAAAVAEGRRVVILPLVGDDLDPRGRALDGSRAAARTLGATVVIDPAALNDTARRVALVDKAVGDMKPAIVYLPAMDETHPARMEAFRIAKAAASRIPTVLGYQTATTGPGFRPEHFVDIGAHFARKQEALGAFSEVASRPDLDPELAAAYARYWGRGHGYRRVEPFEVVKGSL